MPDIQITGLTPAQQQEIVNAFAKIHGPPVPPATPQQWAKQRIFNYIKNVVEAYRNKLAEEQVQSTASQVNQDYGDIA